MFTVYSHIVLTALGDWLELNVAWLLGALMTMLGGIMMTLIGVVIWAIRLEGTVKQVVKDHNELKSDHLKLDVKIDNLDIEFWRHENDPEKHVNKPYMGELAEKVKDLRVSSETATRRIEDKVDGMIRIMLANRGHSTDG